MLQKISNVSISARRPRVAENRNRLILIQEGTDRWEKFRCALQREDRPHFHRLFTRVRCYMQATYQAHDNSMEAILLSIPLDQETRFTPSRKFFRTQGCFVKLLQGWILDLYPNHNAG